MGYPTEGGRKRKSDNDGEQAGDLGSNATSVIVAGTWLSPEKRARTALEVCTMNH
jgi:hypothetical protein